MNIHKFPVAFQGEKVSADREDGESPKAIPGVGIDASHPDFSTGEITLSLMSCEISENANVDSAQVGDFVIEGSTVQGDADITYFSDGWGDMKMKLEVLPAVEIFARAQPGIWVEANEEGDMIWRHVRVGVLPEIFQQLLAHFAQKQEHLPPFTEEIRIGGRGFSPLSAVESYRGFRADFAYCTLHGRIIVTEADGIGVEEGSIFRLQREMAPPFDVDSAPLGQNEPLSKVLRARAGIAASNLPSSTITCPSCGSNMTIRTARHGHSPGSQFYGCTKFPDCRTTRPLRSILH